MGIVARSVPKGPERDVRALRRTAISVAVAEQDQPRRPVSDVRIEVLLVLALLMFLLLLMSLLLSTVLVLLFEFRSIRSLKLLQLAIGALVPAVMGAVAFAAVPRMPSRGAATPEALLLLLLSDTLAKVHEGEVDFVVVFETVFEFDDDVP